MQIEQHALKLDPFVPQRQGIGARDTTVHLLELPAQLSQAILDLHDAVGSPAGHDPGSGLEQSKVGVEQL